MPELRWILIAVGVLLVLYVYVRGRAESRKSARGVGEEARRIEPDTSALGRVGTEMPIRREPTLGGLADQSPGVRDAELDAGPEDYAMPAAGASRPDPAPPNTQPVSGLREDVARDPNSGETRSAAGSAAEGRQEEKIIVLRLASKHTDIPGRKVLSALQAEGLEFGQFNIFHRYAVNGDSAERSTVFSIASMVEPGTIDVDRADEWNTPGLALFLVLPGPRNGAAAFTDMLATARRLAESLEAEVLDNQGSTVTRQTAHHIREEIIEFELRTRKLGR